jgi:hypothetical protein
VCVPQGTFAASKDKTRNGPHPEKHFVNNTYTHNTKFEQLKLYARVKSALTTKLRVLKIKVMLMAMFPILSAAIGI